MAQASRIKPSRKLNLIPYVKRALGDVSFFICLLAALYLLVALVTFHPADAGWTHTGPAQVRNWTGTAGAWLADIGLHFFGYLAYLFPLAIAFSGWRLFRRGELAELDAEIVVYRILGLVVAVGAGCGLASLHLRNVPDVGAGGGILGDMIGPGLIGAFASLGGNSYPIANLFMSILFVTAITLATGRSWLDLLELVGKAVTLPITLLGKLAGIREHALTNATAAPADPAAAAQTVEAERTAMREPQSPAPQEQAQNPVPRLSIVKKQTGSDQPAERSEPVIRLPQEENPLLEQPVATRRQEAEASLRNVSPLPIVRLAAVSSTVVEPMEPAVVTAATTPPPRPESSLLRVVRSKPAAILPDALPPLDLLDPAPPERPGYSLDDLDSMSRHLETLLGHFGIEARVVAIEPGPVITCFEVEPAPGVKVSQISGLAKDLARGLSVTSVRVVEVIPGKSVVGLEIPNKQRQVVYLSEILNSSAYHHSTAPMTIALGKDIGGKPNVANLSKMPHLLVAGTTGSGKSVAINAMLLSMIYKSTPRQVRMILVDPKMLELSVYEDIPHLLAPVVTDMKEAANALRWCVGEMERRYRLMAALKVRNITGFNDKVSAANAAGEPIPDPLFKLADHPEATTIPGLEPLPYIVVVIDELADMMMVVGKKVEELIARLAQKARAAGLHLILATQRPSVDVITGLIKANIPTRIAFQVSSKVDSRTILDQMGAEQLLGHGDMLFLPPGTGFTRRLHGAFVSDQEVLRVVEYLRRTGEPDYSDDILQESGESIPGLPATNSDYSDGAGESDPLYDQAVRIVTESRRASISGVQRRLKIGYNRAARMIEEMETAGIVGPLQSNGNREVLAPPPPEL